jgi:hypothetical protein
MTRHREKCLVCAITVDLLSRAEGAAAADREFEPPAHLIEAVEKMFPANADPAWRVWSDLRRIGADMVWNDSPEAAIAGVRSLRVESRHFVYKASHYSVDLQLDRDTNVTTIALTGQISDEAMPDIPVGNTRVILLLDGALVASAATNEFGEFFLQCEPSTGLRLLVPIEDAGEYIDLSLDIALAVTAQN